MNTGVLTAFIVKRAGGVNVLAKKQQSDLREAMEGLAAENRRLEERVHILEARAHTCKVLANLSVQTLKLVAEQGHQPITQTLEAIRTMCADDQELTREVWGDDRTASGSG